MEIVKAFNENGLSQTITIKGTVNNPLFRASDIGSILEISNVRQTIKDFDNTEKVAVSKRRETICFCIFVNFIRAPMKLKKFFGNFEDIHT